MVEYQLTVRNDSPVAADGAVVRIYENNEQVYAASFEQPVEIGEMVTLSGVFCPEDGSAIHSYQITVEARNSGVESQSITFEVGGCDLGVLDASFRENGLEVLLMNAGSLAVDEARIVVRAGSQTAEPLASFEIGAVDSNTLKQTTLDVEQQPEMYYYVSVETYGNQNPGNDMCLVGYSPKPNRMQVSFVQSTGQITVETPEPLTTDGVLFVSVCDKAGKQTEVHHWPMMSQKLKQTISDPPPSGSIRVMLVQDESYMPLYPKETIVLK